MRYRVIMKAELIATYNKMLYNNLFIYILIIYPLKHEANKKTDQRRP